MAKLDSISPKSGTEEVKPLAAPVSKSDVSESEKEKAVPQTPATPSAKEPLVPEVTAAESVPGAESYDSLFPEPTVTISSPPVWIWWVLLVIAAIAIGLLGYYVANGKINQWLSVPSQTSTTTSTSSSSTPIAISLTSSPTPTSSPVPSASASATPSPAITSSPTASPTASPVTSATVVSVENGTKTAGAATTVANLLKQSGITLDKIGNASSQDHTTTTIYYKTGSLTAAQNVQKILSSYTSTLLESATATGTDTLLIVLGPSH